MNSIIMLSGPVGAGKTTVTKHLAGLIRGPLAVIEGDVFWSFFKNSATGIPQQKNFRTIMISMTAAAAPFALTGHQVILDFSIPPWFLPTANKLLKLRDIPLDYVVLNPGLKVCAARAASRTEGRINDYSIYNGFYDTFAEAEKYTIDDDVSPPEELAAIIYEGLKAKMFRYK